MGVGHFFGLDAGGAAAGWPAHRRRARRLTARIAKQLYPDATIFAKGFEETALPDNFFDAVIGNIPFGNYPVHDPAYRRSPGLTRAIHDYFLAKSLDKLRPGGVMALITSRYTMDKQDSAIRRYLDDRADLVAAIRLPEYGVQGERGHGSHNRHPHSCANAQPGEPPARRIVGGPGTRRHAGRRRIRSTNTSPVTRK